MNPSHSTNEHGIPQTEAQRALVLEQLERLLAHPSFQNSKRYPKFLRSVVEETLAGNAERLKERWLGSEVFDRPSDYDTNQDPVVRLSAGEVRKRLALYYQQPEHRGEVVIALNPGSYVPSFQIDERGGQQRGAEETAARRRRVRKAFVWGGLSVVFAVALVLCWSLIEIEEAQHNFWAPLIHSPNRVTLCAGSPSSFFQVLQASEGPSTEALQRAQPAHGQALELLPADKLAWFLEHSGSLSLSHATALVHIGGYLDNRHKPFRVQLDSQASFPELREGPVVLIGAGDNQWTMRLTGSLRYGFEYDFKDRTRAIVDHKNASRVWRRAFDARQPLQGSDYAVVARYHDAVLDQPVVIVAGLSSVGTEAASEFIRRPEALRTLFRDAPRSADRVNLEAVLETQSIDGHAGPTRVVAIEYW